MKVYFVRHGESIHNAQLIHQHKDVELSETGKKQAEIVAKRFLNIPINTIVASPFARAYQTATIINTTLQKELLFSELFIERKRPTSIEGKVATHPEVVKIKELVLKNINNSSFRHSDEETFFEFRERAQRAINFLKKRNEDNILIVSHGEFIRMMILLMVFGNEVSSDNFLRFNKFMKTKNTGITICEYKNEWRLITWNDHNHLGEV